MNTDKIKFTFPNEYELQRTYDSLCKRLLITGLNHDEDNGIHIFNSGKNQILSFVISKDDEAPSITFNFGTSLSARGYKKLVENIASNCKGSPEHTQISW